MGELAIIIPAYKHDFLESTLDSLCKQTKDDFHVYIGDDNSPHNLEKIVAKYRHKLKITYKKFEQNLGSSSLVDQWKRCINMSVEPWIWLFSDDDIAEPYCVAEFYNIVNKNSDFYKFKSKLIDSDGRNIELSATDITNHIKEPITAEVFINLRLLQGTLRSCAIEYIFSRKIYNKMGIVDFPLAWGSDDATWINYAAANEGITLMDAYVQWRMSGKNISTVLDNKQSNEKKIDASCKLIAWLIEFSKERDINLSNNLLLKRLTFQIAPLHVNLSLREFQKAVKKSGIVIDNARIIYFYLQIKLRYYKRKIISR